MRALGDGGEGEVIVVELRWGPEFAGWERKGKNVSEMIMANSDESFVGQILYFIKCREL